MRREVGFRARSSVKSVAAVSVVLAVVALAPIAAAQCLPGVCAFVSFAATDGSPWDASDAKDARVRAVAWLDQDRNGTYDRRLADLDANATRVEPGTTPDARVSVRYFDADDRTAPEPTVHNPAALVLVRRVEVVAQVGTDGSASNGYDHVGSFSTPLLPRGT